MVLEPYISLIITLLCHHQRSNLGNYGDKMYCAPGTVFHPRLLECTWPYCLPYDNECYEPCGAPCAGWTPDEIQEQCAGAHDITTASP